jgi:ABC-type antimicrobial peptide transport system permease subunit
MNKKTKAKMKLSDYIRLGRISIKARKKSTKNTVFGMAFGLILLVPMIFFAVAFYSDLSKQVNSVKTASELYIPLKNVNDASGSTPYKEYTSNSEGQEGLPAYAFNEDLLELDEVSEYMMCEYSNMYLKQSYMNLHIGSETFSLYDEDNQGGNFYGMNTMKIVFPEKSSSIMFTDNELIDYKKMTGKNSPFINICNKGFTESTKGKGEIILSEPLLNQWGIDEEDIANKEISIAYPEILMGSYSSYYAIDNDYIPSNEFEQFSGNPEDEVKVQLYLVYKFKVVGILKSDYYELPGKLNEPHIWVTSPSVYFTEGKDDYATLDYALTDMEDFGTILTFNRHIDEMYELNRDGGYMFRLQGICDRYIERWSRSGNRAFELNPMRLKLQIKDYSLLSEFIPKIKNILKSAYNDMPSNDFTSTIANEIYNQFMIIDMVGKILILVFSAIGGIIFFTNMLNLLNTVRYSVESRKNYIGVMRAIGAKSKVIPKLYIVEIMIIFFKTFIWVSIFATLISYGLKFGLDKGFEYMAVIASFKVNFIYYPLSLGAAFLVTTIIGTFFARVSCKLTAYQPILKTLYDEK